MNADIARLHSFWRAKYYDIFAGERYGRWLIIGIFEQPEHGSVMCLCRCDCGSERKVAFQHLRRGESKQCVECGRKAVIKHGHTAKGNTSSTYDAWHTMIQRCQNPNNGGYHRYGGRGITVCSRWNDFRAFLLDMGEKPKGLTLERKDNDKGYEPENCKWATREEQCVNKRTTRFVSVDGEKMCVTKAASVVGMHLNTFRAHLYRRKTLSKNGRIIILIK